MVGQARIGLVQFLPVPGDSETNTRYACGQIRELAGADLIVLPELWPNGCDGQTAAADLQATAEPLDGPRTERLAAAAADAGAWVVAGSVPERVGSAIFNTALVFDRRGTLVATHRKAHLYTPLDEHLIYTAGDSLLIVDTDLGPLGVATCFDADFPEVPRRLADAGARIVAHPCAYEAAAQSWWDRLYPAAALANGLWWISANQCGTNGGVTELGGSRILSPVGDTVAELPRAAEGDSPAARTGSFTVDLEAGWNDWREHAHVLRELVRADLPIRRISPAS